MPGKSYMKKSLIAGDRSKLSAQRIHSLLLLLLGLAFVALGFRSYPAFIAVGLLFVLVSYRGYTASRLKAKSSESDPN
jgi:uncharacterized membrane protein